MGVLSIFFAGKIAGTNAKKHFHTMKLIPLHINIGLLTHTNPQNKQLNGVIR